MPFPIRSRKVGGLTFVTFGSFGGFSFYRRRAVRRSAIANVRGREILGL